MYPSGVMRTDPRTSASFPFPPRDVPLKNIIGRAFLLLFFDDDAVLVVDADDNTEDEGDDGGEVEAAELGGDGEQCESEGLGEGEGREFCGPRFRD